MSEAPVLRELAPPGVLRLTLNRPTARNAMNREMVDALREAAAQAEADPSIRAIVLRGAGGHFCAGGDVKEMAGARAAPAPSQDGEDPGDPIAALNGMFGTLALAFARSSVPVVAAVEGAAMGGGFGLACTADVILAAESADFRLPETSLGVVPAQIAPFLAERLGPTVARRLALTGARLDGAAARGIGLVDQVVPADELDAALEAVLGRILAGAPQATRATKRLFHRLAAAGPVDQAFIDHAAGVFAAAARGDEAAAGMGAFLSKGRPPWDPAAD